MTDKQIKTMVVYNEDASKLTPDEKFRFDAFSALWEQITSVFINDEDLTPINPSNQ